MAGCSSVGVSAVQRCISTSDPNIKVRSKQKGVSSEECVLQSIAEHIQCLDSTETQLLDGIKDFHHITSYKQQFSLVEKLNVFLFKHQSKYCFTISVNPYSDSNVQETELSINPGDRSIVSWGELDPKNNTLKNGGKRIGKWVTELFYTESTKALTEPEPQSENAEMMVLMESKPRPTIERRVSMLRSSTSDAVDDDDTAEYDIHAILDMPETQNEELALSQEDMKSRLHKLSKLFTPELSAQIWQNGSCPFDFARPSDRSHLSTPVVSIQDERWLTEEPDDDARLTTSPSPECSPDREYIRPSAPRRKATSIDADDDSVFEETKEKEQAIQGEGSGEVDINIKLLETEEQLSDILQPAEETDLLLSDDEAKQFIASLAESFSADGEYLQRRTQRNEGASPVDQSMGLSAPLPLSGNSYLEAAYSSAPSLLTSWESQFALNPDLSFHYNGTETQVPNYSQPTVPFQSEIAPNTVFPQLMTPEKAIKLHEIVQFLKSCFTNELKENRTQLQRTWATGLGNQSELLQKQILIKRKIDYLKVAQAKISGFTKNIATVPSYVAPIAGQYSTRIYHYLPNVQIVPTDSLPSMPMPFPSAEQWHGAHSLETQRPDFGNAQGLTKPVSTSERVSEVCSVDQIQHPIIDGQIVGLLNTDEIDGFLTPLPSVNLSPFDLAMLDSTKANVPEESIDSGIEFSVVTNSALFHQKRPSFEGSEGFGGPEAKRLKPNPDVSDGGIRVFLHNDMVYFENQKIRKEVFEMNLKHLDLLIHESITQKRCHEITKLTDEYNQKKLMTVSESFMSCRMLEFKSALLKKK